MSKYLAALVLVISVVAFQFCASSRKAKAAKAPAITYENSIKPTIDASCAPCHITGKGNKKPLDSYAAASQNIDDIISRIQKNPDEKGFMPFRHPKLPDSTINKFVQWKNTALIEK